MDSLRVASRRVVAVLRKRRSYLAGSWLEYLIVTALFITLTLIYTNFVLLNGTHQLFIEGPGDGTAGFLWFNYADHDNSPLLGHTDLINYPVGDTIGNPVYVTYSVHIVALWVMTKVFGPIMAINIWTFIGFLSCAVAAYWLVKKLTHNVCASLFAAFAATYVPYHIMNSTSHISYIFSVVFILLFASTYGFWRKPSFKRAALLAATIGVSYYLDGYFILISTMEVLGLIVFLFLYSAIFEKVVTKKYLWSRLKYCGIAVGVLVLLAAPIALVQVSQAKTINSNLSNARADIKTDMDTYSTKFMDFIVPSVHNPFLIDDPAFQQVQKYKNSRSNAMENTLYVGYVVLILDIIALVLALSYKLRKQKSSLRLLPSAVADKLSHVALISIAGAAAMLLWLLPREFVVLGHHVPTPAWLLANFGISLWRVLARFFLPMHFLLVLAAAIALAMIGGIVHAKMHGKKRGRIVMGILLLVVTGLCAAEYATLTNRPSYDFKHIPQAYYWLKDQNDISAVAELPLVDRPLEASYNYVTAQIVHGKKLVNDQLLSLPIGDRNALGDIDNQEAIDYSIKRGVQAIITHDHPCLKDVSWGKLVYEDPNTPTTNESFYYGSPICIYKVTESAQSVDGLFPSLKRGSFADAPLTKGQQEYDEVYGDKGVIIAKDVEGSSVTGTASLKAKTTITPGVVINGGGTWQVMQDGVMRAQGEVGSVIDTTIDASRPIEVKVIWNNQVYKDTLYAFSLVDIGLTRY